ncbi:auxin-responsive protein SAUR32-like [Gastrolobium bilobum]|uniref:auxin-responsive protein SAUR32-like n=1 Tax=Gastrolobium bilobum TaxID=150636 RepID=UPI002AB276B7|nr:auxin-responsive protein SAUR32-like [Gastrolobium bilobum]
MEVHRKMLKSLITKVLKGLPFLAHSGSAYPRRAYMRDIDDENETEIGVPEDVREGHFAVIAIKGEEAKRFIVELDYLNDPGFLRLLEQAREEYGFGQKGALAVPCRPQELEKIIENRQVESAIINPI